MKSLLKALAARLMRPGLVPVHDRLSQLEARLAAINDAAAARSEAHGSSLAAIRHEHGRALERVQDTMESVCGRRIEREKHREELAFWTWLITTDEGRASLPEPFDVCFGRWQRDRLRELGLALDVLDLRPRVRLDPAWNGVIDWPEDRLATLDQAVDDWCATRTAVEIGSGPYPAIAAAPRWQRAVAVDPIARAYAEGGLLPPTAAHVVMVESPGEHIPLPSGMADLIVLENALDHVSNPAAVVAEGRRLLGDGGLLWLLVDLSRHTDHMHPHPFDEPTIRGLVASTGFEVVADRVSDHKSHPNAYGEYRCLARKLVDAPRGGGALDRAERSAASLVKH